MPADTLSAVARDLAALAGADRRAILAGLDSDDRHRLRAAMRGHGPVPPPRPAVPGRHSDWFEALMAAARNGEDRMTVVARAALLDAQGLDGPGIAPRVPGRTLLQAAGGLLAAGKTR
jgi:hypothetical protein